MRHLNHFIIILFTLILTVSCSSGNKEKNINPYNLSDNLLEKQAVVQNATFQDLEGNEVKLSDFKGKVVMIDFWETWCGPCLRLFPVMDSLQNDYQDDFVILAANLNNSDTREDVLSFREKNPYSFRFLIDVNGVGPEVIEMGIPFKLYFDPEGYLIKAEVGVRGNDYEHTRDIIEEYKES